MRYVSTRGRVEPIGFQDSVLMGLADDGGLVVPESIPNVADRLDRWRRLNYNALAFEILRLYATDLPEADLKGLIEKSYACFDPEGDPDPKRYLSRLGTPVAPTVKVGPIHVLELWHGPTLAFKDVALQLLGNLFEYILSRRASRAPVGKARLNILGATSGDTGSAAICGVRGRSGINIFVMHPHQRVSPIQERQMTTVLDENVHNIAVQGSFDDCQRIMKALAGDLDFKREYALGAVNSVNWTRVMAQIVYYFRAVFDVQEATGAASVRVSVPTGNFGDVLAGYYALRMGLPISKLILATNENDILARFFNTGVYSVGPTVFQTLSPSMDIQVASNFERYLYYKVGSSPTKLCALMDSFSRTGSLTIQPGADGVVDCAFVSACADRESVLQTIRRYYESHGYLLDPHSAVGVAVAERFGLDAEPVVCLATAHPAKFPEAIRRATGKDIARHPRIDELMQLPTRCAVLPHDQEAVRKFIMEKVR